MCGIEEGERNEGHTCKYPDVIVLRGGLLRVFVPVYWRHTRNAVGIGGDAVDYCSYDTASVDFCFREILSHQMYIFQTRRSVQTTELTYDMLGRLPLARQVTTES